jgi:TRAP transporter TAXI family solute receptor
VLKRGHSAQQSHSDRNENNPIRAEYDIHVERFPACSPKEESALFSRLSIVPRVVLAAGLCMLGICGIAFAQDRQDTTKVIRIGAGPTGATDFPFGGLIANAISNPPGSRECDRGGSCGVPGLIAVAQTTANAADNLRAIARGDLDLALSQADVTSWAYRGAGAFANEEPMEKLRVIARLYPENVHLVVRAESPIKTIADLKGKKVAMGAESSATAATAKLILSVFGVKWDSVQMKYLDFAVTSDALSKNTVDAAFLVSGAPVLALEDLAGRLPIRLVPIAGPAADKLAQVFPFYSRGVIPSGTYGAAQPPVETIDVAAPWTRSWPMASFAPFGMSAMRRCSRPATRAASSWTRPWLPRTSACRS